MLSLIKAFNGFSTVVWECDVIPGGQFSDHELSIA